MKKQSSPDIMAKEASQPIIVPPKPKSPKRKKQVNKKSSAKLQE